VLIGSRIYRCVVVVVGLLAERGKPRRTSHPDTRVARDVLPDRVSAGRVRVDVKAVGDVHGGDLDHHVGDVVDGVVDLDGGEVDVTGRSTLVERSK
jgi:hypothetical protein